MPQENPYWARREEIISEFLEELDHEELVLQTAAAKDGKVRSIRACYKEKKVITTRQAAVLAGWLADQRMEEEGEEDDDTKEVR